MTNLRHYESLQQTQRALDDITAGIASEVSNDLLALDKGNALHHLGEITTEKLLENIFSKFCIGKWKGPSIHQLLPLTYNQAKESMT